MDRVAFSVEGDRFGAVDVSGHRHEWAADVPRTIVLQTDLCVGALQRNGSNNSLLVLDGEGRTLVNAPRRPFDRAQVAAFCSANGLELRETERDYGQPAQPAKGPGYVALTVSRQATVWQVVVLAAGVLIGLVGPLPFLVPALAGGLAAIVLWFALS